ncbi:MAG: TetR/AcrR family transcriptional regulator [Mycobacterium sp.]
MACRALPDPPRYTAKGRATRERILRSAAQVLLSEGVSGFNLDKVRHTGSVSGSQLTHYFADRQALIRGLVERQIEVVLDFHRQPSLAGLQTFEDFERWAQLNLGYLRNIGYRGTPTYHVLAGQLAKSDGATRDTLAAGYWRWVELLEEAFRHMKSTGTLVTPATPRQLALILIAGHQGAGLIAFAHWQEWPLADACRFVVNYLRLFATDPDERLGRKATRPRRRRTDHTPVDDGRLRFTKKGVATRDRIVRGAADIMFEHGANRTSLDDVRKSVGVSGSQLSHYFDGKRDLTRHVVALRTRDVLEFQSRPELGQLDSIEALRNWAGIYTSQVETQYLRGGCIYGSLVGELLEGDEEVLGDLAAGYDHWHLKLQAGLTAMRRRGELNADADPRHLAAVLLVAHQGGTMLTYTIGTAEPFRLALNAAVDYVASFCPRTDS